MKRFAASVALAGALVVTALSPAAARHYHHYVYARLGAGVCSGYTCTGAFFRTMAGACGAVIAPVTTRNVALARPLVCPSGLGVTRYLVLR